VSHTVHIQPDVKSALRECVRFVAAGGWRASGRPPGGGDGRMCLIAMLREACPSVYDYDTACRAVALGIQNYGSPPSFNPHARHIITSWNDVLGRTPEQVAGVLAWALEYLENNS